MYFDHSATTPLDKEVLEKMLPYLTENYGNADSLHGIGRKSRNAVDNARDTVAKLISADAKEVYFTSGGTESDNWAVYGVMTSQKAVGRDKLLVSAVEHHAVIETAEKLKKQGFTVEYLPVNKDCKVERETLEKAVDERTGLVVVMGANNEIGSVNDIKTLAEITHEKGGLFFADCVQLAPYCPLNTKELGVDLLSFSSHKFYGPKGSGVLFVKKGVKIEKLVVGGEQERGLRGGTLNVPNIVGLAYAYEKCVRDMETNNAYVTSLKNKFLQGVEDIAVVNGKSDLPAILNLRFLGTDNATLLMDMDLNGMAVSAGSACASNSVKPSHVLTAMGLTDEEARASLRFSFGKDNTEEEIDEAISLTRKIVIGLKEKNK